MNMQSKIALITGANKGLGLETARQLSKCDVCVIVSARNGQNLQRVKEQFALENINADFFQLDITKMEEIKQIQYYINNKYGKLDILINNAGISNEKSNSYEVNTSADVSIDNIREVYETNVFGTIALTQALLPLIKKSEGGRVVNLSSELGSLNLHADPASPIYKLKKFAYDSSKTILNQFTIHLAEALRDSDIKVNSVSPGWVKTDMGTQYAPLEIPQGVQIIVEAATLPKDGPSGSFFTHKMQTIVW
jgi:NAD(P)-dependent dehydrogenase (short-subunit alcohol dehydrogenase family)